MKNRIFHQLRNDYFDWRLEAHHSGDLLLIDSSYNGACNWTRALVMNITERGGLWVCKYGKHDIKFPLPKAPLHETQNAIDEFGLEVDYSLGSSFIMSHLHESPAASGFLEWCIRHKRMAKEFHQYREHLIRLGVTPIKPELYTGY